MHSIRPRPICRARNAFSPAIALWQHFVAANQQLAGRLPGSSFATEAARTGNDGNERQSHKDLPADSNAIPIGQAEGALVRKSNRTPVRFVKRNPGGRQFGRFSDPPAKASTSKNHIKSVSGDVEKLLKAAYDAYDASEDYQGVVVAPIDLEIGVHDYSLPWNIREYKDLRPDQK